MAAAAALPSEVKRVTRVEYAEVPTAPVAGNAAAAPPLAPPLPAFPQPASNTALFCVDKKVYAAGGYIPGAGTHGAVAEYDLMAKQWASVGTLPAPRSEGTAVCAGGIVVLFGGWNDREVVASTLVAKAASWSEGGHGAGKPSPFEPLPGSTPVQPPARRMHSMTSLTDADGKSTVYVFGGFNGQVRLNDLWQFDVASQQWSAMDVQGALPSPRDNATLVADAERNCLYLFGGYSTCRTNELFVYDLESGTWTKQPTVQPPAARMGTWGALSHGALLVGMGQDAKGASKDIFQLKTADWKWSVVPVEGDELEPRIQFGWCTTDSGKRLVLFGGATDRRLGTNVFEIELEKIEPVPAPGKKK